MNPEAFDLQVAVEEPLREQYKGISVGNPAVLREISILDKKISSVVQAIHATKLKCDFMRGFEKDPVGFLNKWVESQSRDLQVLNFSDNSQLLGTINFQMKKLIAISSIENMSKKHYSITLPSIHDNKTEVF